MNLFKTKKECFIIARCLLLHDVIKRAAKPSDIGRIN